MSQKDYLDNTNADIRLIGVPGIFSPLSQFTSASRLSMLTHHLSQAMILKKPEFPRIFTGVENELINYTINSSRRKYDCEIIAIIPKYRSNFLKGTMDDCPEIFIIVSNFLPNGQRQLDYFTIDRYFMGQNGFGYIPVQQNLHRLRPGEILDKDTPLTHSPAVQGNRYALGTNLNVVYGSFPETIEDAFVISESAAEKLMTDQVSQITIDCRQDQRPLNLNGDDDEEKFLPDIGSYVRDDGALCATRPSHWTTIIADSDPKSLREVLPLQDRVIYVPPKAKIIDLTFNMAKNKNTSLYQQAERYIRNNFLCWEEIFRVYTRYQNSCKISEKMSTLVVTAIYRMIASGVRPKLLENDFGKVLKNYDIEGPKRQTIDFLQATVTYTVPRKVSRGDKITDLHGAKGVFGAIYKDEWMPRDEHGFVADIWIDMNSPVGRNNPGQLYETGLGRIAEFARRRVEATKLTSGTEAAFEVVLDMYNDVNPNYALRTRETVKETYQKEALVNDAIETGIKLWVPPYLNTLTPSKDNRWNALENMKRMQIKWGAHSSPITYSTPQRDGSVKTFKTFANFSIGPKYFILLHKIPEIFAPGPASINHLGIPTKSSHESKYFPVSRNPYRFGEDELRVMAMDTAIQEVTRFQNLTANSPWGVSAAIKCLLLADHPTRLSRVPVSNGDLARTSAALQLFHNVTTTLGVETKDTLVPEGFINVSPDVAESILKMDIDYESGRKKTETSLSVQARKNRLKRERIEKALGIEPNYADENDPNFLETPSLDEDDD